ncbi:MAG: hypothetical protein M5U35_14385 [Roseovarius sp.]|nr:hypothetical protein [Roseovarius sp.]
MATPGVSIGQFGDLWPDLVDGFLAHPGDLVIRHHDHFAAGILEDLQGMIHPVQMHLAGFEVGRLENAVDLFALPVGQRVPLVEVDEDLLGAARGSSRAGSHIGSLLQSDMSSMPPVSQ